MTFSLTSIIASFLIILLQSAVVFSVTESESLLTFRNSLVSNHSTFTSWKLPKPPCTGNKANWAGVLCEKNQVLGLQLEGMGISGIIHVESLQELPHLRTMSLSNNNLEGKLPKLSKLGMLRSIYLSRNKFSGEIDGDCFEGMMSLKKVYLEKNAFTGQIPISLTVLSRLVELNIEGNQFSGAIPTFKSVQFKVLNLSNNQFQGQIPNEFNYLTAQSFAGNPGLCGPPLQACSTPTNSNSNSSSLSIVKIILICVAILVVISIFMIIFLTIKKNGQSSQRLNLEAPPPPVRSKPMPEVTSELGSPARSKKSSEAAGKLVFLKEDREKFELPDLLKSSAEMLGNGCLGAYYKACLPSGKPMVVKRFKHMNNVGREEFQEHMWRIGRLNNPYLLSPVAFYYRKEEKLVVSDYVNNATLSTYLNGKSKDQQSLNWASRLKIIKGVAKGLMYLHTELPSLIVPHGHLKSSNVLLTESLEPLLSDYALIPVVNPDHAQKSMQAYKSPEYNNNNRVTKKADIWCLGIVILETLTAKSPQQGSGSDVDWETWVNSLANKNATEVFDKKMMETKHNEGEMTKLFKIGLLCVEQDADKRSDMKEIVKKIDELKE